MYNFTSGSRPRLPRPHILMSVIFAVELSTGKGRLILKDFIVVGEKGKNS